MSPTGSSSTSTPSVKHGAFTAKQMGATGHVKGQAGRAVFDFRPGRDIGRKSCAPQAELAEPGLFLCAIDRAGYEFGHTCTRIAEQLAGVKAKPLGNRIGSIEMITAAGLAHQRKGFRRRTGLSLVPVLDAEGRQEGADIAWHDPIPLSRYRACPCAPAPVRRQT